MSYLVGGLVAALAFILFTRGADDAGVTAGGKPVIEGAGNSLRLRGPGGEDITRNFTDSVLRWATTCKVTGQQVGVDARILLTIIANESNGVPQPGALDEYGLMQLRPIAVRDVAQNTGLPYVPPSEMSDEENIRYGAEYYALTKRRTRSYGVLPGTHYQALRAYNAGIGRAKESTAAGHSYAMRALGRINFPKDRT